MLNIYGIASCDSVRKAKNWLKENNIDYNFHDFRKDGITKKMIKNWLKVTDKDVLINRLSTTWRSLSDKEKTMVTDRSSLVDLLCQYPEIIKRPVLDKDGVVIAGFKKDNYQELFMNNQKLKK